MARAIWTGSLSFGLVSVPVGLFSATEDKTIHFNQFQAGTSDRIRNRRVNERTGEEVDYREIVKGFDTGGGDYVLVTPDELEGVAPEKSSSIEVLDFVDLREIDPIFFQRAYYLAPQGEQAKRAYALLQRVMAEEQRVGIATFVMRNKEYLVAVRPGDGVLVLETMYFSDEIRDPMKEIEGLSFEAAFSKRELETAKLLVESMSAGWDAENYRDTYRGRVEELIERKRKGEAVVSGPPPKKPARVTDLADALQRSVEAAKSRRRGGEEPAGARGAVAGGEGRERGRGRKGARASATPPHAAQEKLSAMSKAELYELAGELELPGRSKMSRSDLERAIRAATDSRRRRAS